MKPNKQARLILLVISCISQERNEGQPVTWTWALNSLVLKFCVSVSLSDCSSPSWERHETLSGICDWVSTYHDNWLLLAYTCKNCVCYSNTLTEHGSQVSFNIFCSYQDNCRLLSPPSQELEAVCICMAPISHYSNCSTYIIIILVCISF